MLPVASTLRAAVQRAADRPGPSTHALDQLESREVENARSAQNVHEDGVRSAFSNITNIIHVGADKRKANGGKRGPAAGNPPIENLHKALTLWLTDKHEKAEHDPTKISQRQAAQRYGITQNHIVRMSKKLNAPQKMDATTFEAKLAQIQQMQWAKKGNPDVNAQTYFTEDEEKAIAAAIALRGSMGFPLDVQGIAAHLEELLVSMKKKQNSWTGKDVVCCPSYVNSFILKYDLDKYKSSAIDPLRAAAASKKTRDAFFDLIDRVIKEEYEKGKVPWARFEDVPLEYKYNMDEEGKDTNKGRGFVVGKSKKTPKKASTKKQCDVERAEAAPATRVWERTDGDHMPYHATNVQV